MDVAPVIQFKSPTADIFSAKKQIRFYKEHAPDLRLICISNHAFNIERQSSAISEIVKMIQDSWAGIKIHVLGAGFNSKNVADWMKTGVTSMDSVSYYSDSPKHKWIFGTDRLEASTQNFKETALYNASVAVQSARNFKVFV